MGGKVELSEEQACGIVELIRRCKPPWVIIGSEILTVGPPRMHVIDFPPDICDSGWQPFVDRRFRNTGSAMELFVLMVNEHAAKIIQTFGQIDKETTDE